ncbi:transcription antitermination factor NusB [Clostridium tertium]|jgi:transcription antitermination protein NusB|uniref:Transcription antitermination protein NusB n=1 Tax=Clostridium tertium TaxID=1559 RepID=A0A9X3XS60_9CLOT|nr:MULTISPECIES: transcription antitermination factor NusB [Clostridium]EEH97680.1 transcription antitermination factor NusB [Clostridium sp. 7_2_43FAA]MBS5306518.1 transcription antitermination factor NusB [Clostridium sp.]MBS5885422.1 transcription antitermination factor NusB [Clostridium sp.]MBS6502686.1 transcription antitermination factor NusB [Clostridium sp.]MBU6135181.1 transcription antitermination factor NusB [Clostridium tertium]
MNRKRSREIAMELLFGMTLSKNTLEETIETFIEDYEMNLKTIDLEYIKGILAKVEENITVIDQKIEEALTNWKIDRVSKVNISILRLAIAEMLYVEDVPEKVAINEAIELTKKYSDEKSVSFVNGVLDKAFKSL